MIGWFLHYTCQNTINICMNFWLSIKLQGQQPGFRPNLDLCCSRTRSFYSIMLSKRTNSSSRKLVSNSKRRCEICRVVFRWDARPLVCDCCELRKYIPRNPKPPPSTHRGADKVIKREKWKTGCSQLWCKSMCVWFGLSFSISLFTSLCLANAATWKHFCFSLWPNVVWLYANRYHQHYLPEGWSSLRWIQSSTRFRRVQWRRMLLILLESNC